MAVTNESLSVVDNGNGTITVTVGPVAVTAEPSYFAIEGGEVHRLLYANLRTAAALDGRDPDKIADLIATAAGRTFKAVR